MTGGAVSRLLQELSSKTANTVDPGFADWADETRRFHHEFWRTRLIREEAITRALTEEPPASIQPGLFDRRAEGSWAADRERHDELVAEIERRIAGARRSIELQLHHFPAALVAGR
jgi:hypothetical protein